MRQEFRKLLVANRAEIAIRILRTAAEMRIPTLAVYSEDDARCLHVRRADEAQPLRGAGAAAYLDLDQLLEIASAEGCDALHPGYGFLSERPELATRCREAGVTFVGPSAEVLDRLGDKSTARALAESVGIPVLRGSSGSTTVEEARAFLASLGPGGAAMIKAIAGGGGRGMRAVGPDDDIASAYERCRSEARAAFGREDVYIEERLVAARHIEVQIAGDGEDAVHLWERECTLQRRHQKLVEMAPSPSLDPPLRKQLLDAAVKLAREVGYRGLGTFEFLVDAHDPTRFAFLEANPRLQVEHTVTEEITGLDLVRLQLDLARGAALAEVGLEAAGLPAPQGHAVQVRINMETLGPDGAPRPSTGTLTAYEPASGPGIRVDGFGYAGYTPSTSFDSLLAKLVAHSRGPDPRDALARAARALGETRIEGIATNIDLLQQLLRHPEVQANRVTTGFVEEHADEWSAGSDREPLFFSPEHEVGSHPVGSVGSSGSSGSSESAQGPGARIDSEDPLAVLAHGRENAAAGIGGVGGGALVAGRPGGQSLPAAPQAVQAPPGTTAVCAPVQGTVVQLQVAPDDPVHEEQPLLVMESMKMEHVVTAGVRGRVREIVVEPGDTVFEGAPLLFVAEGDVEVVAQQVESAVDLDHVRPDLAEVIERHGFGLDSERPQAVARRRKTGQRTARENVEDLCDEGSFIEYGSLVIAAQRRRRSIDDLVRNTPADGLVAGVGSVNSKLFEDVDSRCVIMSYDYTVLAGTQGLQNHRKKDRLFELAEDWRLPLVFFTEGGGGRPGDTDGSGVAGLDCWAFHDFGRLSGLVPLVGINSGRCFAGNAALLGCCDVIIATENSNIGMGGPAMIEGGGLGVFRPDEVGPMSDQVPNGVVDIPVRDEAEAVAVAKRYLSYFQGPLAAWECADQRLLRSAIPENRLRIYDVRQVIETLADQDSVLELRRHFGAGMVTALARIEGRPVGIVANNPTHLAGAIDREGADKAARFMQLCDAFDVPLVFLCDTPGIMVGPDSERSALVRHASRMFVVGANLTVPFMTIVLRKGYGLGAQAMAGGSFKAPFFTVSWPTGEFGGMGLEGAVKLGFRRELEAVEDPAERRALYQEMVDRMYTHGKAVNMASHFEIDDVIDPSDSRRWIVRALRAAPPPSPRTGKKRPCVDAW